MTILKATIGTKKVTVRKGQDGYGDVIFRASLTQDFFDGIEEQERFIDVKSFNSEKRAINWAKKQLA
jgi:hypothetical protein